MKNCSLNSAPCQAGWGASVVLHGAAFAAFFLLQPMIKPLQPSESFRWEVSLVTPPPTTVEQAWPAPEPSPKLVASTQVRHEQIQAPQEIHEINTQKTRSHLIAHSTPSIHQVVRKQTTSARPQARSIPHMRAETSVTRNQAIPTHKPAPHSHMQPRVHTIKTPLTQKTPAPMPIHTLSAQELMKAQAVSTATVTSLPKEATQQVQSTSTLPPPAVVHTHPPSSSSRVVRRDTTSETQIIAQAHPQQVSHASTPDARQQTTARRPLTSQAISDPMESPTQTLRAIATRRDFTDAHRAIFTGHPRQEQHVTIESRTTAQEALASVPKKIHPKVEKTAQAQKQETVKSPSPSSMTAQAASRQPLSDQQARMVHRRVERTISPRSSESPPSIHKVAIPSTNRTGTVTKTGYGPEILAFLRDLYQRIQQAQDYPAIARQMGLEGTTTVQLTLLSNGTASSLEVTNPSGYDILDNAAVQTISRILPLVPPASVAKTALAIEVPIQFELR